MSFGSFFQDPQFEQWIRIGSSVAVILLSWVLGHIFTRIIKRWSVLSSLLDKISSFFNQPNSDELKNDLAQLIRFLFFIVGLWASWKIIYPIEIVQAVSKQVVIWHAWFVQLPTVIFVFDLLLVILGALLLNRIIGWIKITFEKLANSVESQRGKKLKTIKLQRVQLLSADQLTNAVLTVNTYTRYLVNILLFLIYLTSMFSLFPQTRGMVILILNSIGLAIEKSWLNFANYLPNLINLIVIIVVSNYLLKFLHFIFNEIGKGTISFRDFNREWAEPTYQIVRFLFIALALVVAFPFLPGSESPAFQGVSIFIGFLFSMGSSSVVANIMAGLVLTYTGAFKLGDRVKIADTTGDVIQKTLLVTRVRTIKNVDITIPNGMVLGSHIVNYSSVAQEHGLILNTTITLGYDISWRLVHEALKKAALATPNILPNPKPFVLQTSLDDFYVSYELNAYTNLASKMALIYSELHQNIQDYCNEAGIEILSPHYRSIRDGNQSTIPADYLPKDYQAPPFQVNVSDDKKSSE